MTLSDVKRQSLPNVSYFITDEKEKDVQISKFTQDFFGTKLPTHLDAVEQKINLYQDKLTKKKGEANALKVTNQPKIDKVGRFFRSLGLIALYTLGIITIMPAFIALVVIKDKVMDVARRYITLKSPQQIQLEVEWEQLKQETKTELRDPLNYSAEISGFDTHLPPDYSWYHIKLSAKMPEMPAEQMQRMAACQDKINIIHNTLKQELFLIA